MALPNISKRAMLKHRYEPPINPAIRAMNPNNCKALQSLNTEGLKRSLGKVLQPAEPLLLQAIKGKVLKLIPINIELMAPNNHVQPYNIFIVFKGTKNRPDTNVNIMIGIIKN